jgi:hypothetical protein
MHPCRLQIISSTISIAKLMAPCNPLVKLGIRIWIGLHRVSQACISDTMVKSAIDF